MKRIVKITYEYDDGTTDSLDIPRPMYEVDKHQWPVMPAPIIDYKSCPKCGIALDRVMGYCCSNPGCPTGLGPVMC